MAGSSLLTLIDDIASILDDVAVMTKVATKKTAGVLGDDLALNAEQVNGVRPERELPVVWAVAKGSTVNKLILVPAALAISVLIPWAVVPLLMLGGAFLCYEGFEKVVHKLGHGHKADDAAHRAQHLAVLTDPTVDPVALEKTKIKGAIRTDFILSAEIIVIALGTVATASFGKQVAVLVGLSAIMTIGVYGLVAGIVKLDDGGLHLSRQGGAKASIGRGIVAGAPYLMKGLSIAGTAAMFTVGGGILTHGVAAVDAQIHRLAHAAGSVPGIGGVLEAIAPTLANALAGVAVGGMVLLVVTLAKRATVRPKVAAAGE